jgi:Uma2 family endonuclease
MVETSIHIPRTIMEVFHMLPEGTLAEVINNTLYMSPTPTLKHQRLSRKLSTQSDHYVSALDCGEIFYAPLDVFLDHETNAVQPDIFFIAKENAVVLNANGTIHGIPDLIIEILSPGNRKHDLVIKKDLYEKFGVKEYWTVDPDTKEVVGYEHLNDRYTALPASPGEIKSTLLHHTFTF